MRKPGEVGSGPAAGNAEARARAYLDLWERHLVHLALHGPSTQPSPAPAAR